VVVSLREEERCKRKKIVNLSLSLFTFLKKRLLQTLTLTYLFERRKARSKLKPRPFRKERIEILMIPRLEV